MGNDRRLDDCELIFKGCCFNRMNADTFYFWHRGMLEYPNVTKNINNYLNRMENNN